MQMIPTEELNQAVTEFDRAGYIIKIHTAGDGAVRVLWMRLKSRERQMAIQRFPSHSLTQDMLHQDIPRFKSLNAVADFAPYLWYPRPIIESVVQAVGLPRGATVLADEGFARSRCADQRRFRLACRSCRYEPLAGN